MSKMKDYITAGTISLHAGKVRLSADQARRRMHLLAGKESQKSGIFEIVKPLQFKAGEAFGYDGEIPKTLSEIIIEATAPAEAAEPEELPEKKSETGK